MRRLGLVLAFLMALPAAVSAQDTNGVPILKYTRVTPDWPAPPVGDKGIHSHLWSFWSVTSVAVEANGDILVMHRGDDPILEYKPDGTFIGPWGKLHFSHGKVIGVFANERTPDMSGYQALYGHAGCSNCGAHEIRVDPEGNVWVVDAPGQIITKLDANGHTLMTLGTRDKPGKSATNFYLPTDIAFAPNGELVVTDGYGNARVVRFSHDGKYLGEFGSRGSGPGQFQLPHNVVIDRQGRLYVADRDNQRVEVFDSQGKYLSEWDHVGVLSSLIMTPDQHIWAGGMLRDLDGKPVGVLPGEGANAQAHGGAAAPNGDVYLGLLSGIVEKFVKQ